jgi:hypothetical protein
MPVACYGFRVARLRALAKSLFAWPKAFLDKFKACSSPACSGIRQDLSARNALMNAQRKYGLGSSPFRVEKHSTPYPVTRNSQLATDSGYSMV